MGIENQQGARTTWSCCGNIDPNRLNNFSKFVKWTRSWAKIHNFPCESDINESECDMRSLLLKISSGKKPSSKTLFYLFHRGLEFHFLDKLFTMNPQQMNQFQQNRAIPAHMMSSSVMHPNLTSMQQMHPQQQQQQPHQVMVCGPSATPGNMSISNSPMPPHSYQQPQMVHQMPPSVNQQPQQQVL